MTKKFAFQEIFRNGCTINFDEGAVTAGTLCMESFSNEFFPGAAFAGNQYGCVDLADAFNKGIYPLHCLAFANKTVKKGAFVTLVNIFQVGKITGSDNNTEKCCLFIL